MVYAVKIGQIQRGSGFGLALEFDLHVIVKVDGTGLVEGGTRWFNRIARLGVSHGARARGQTEDLCLQTFDLNGLPSGVWAEVSARRAMDFELLWTELGWRAAAEILNQ